MRAATLAIDFGTSNSACAVFQDGQIRRLAIEGHSDTLPTAVFFPSKGRMQIGQAASDALIDGEEGRYMRALKSVLGTPLAHEPRVLGGKRQTILDVTAAFLREVKERAEAATGMVFTSALSGRPVRFHSADAGRNAQAETDLRACYAAAGFATVDFLPEPEAAARACQGMGNQNGLGLIVDIGGGTSDFSIFESADGSPRIVATYGVRLGGTDFDHLVSMDRAMPALGLGSMLRREMGEGLLPVPKAPYLDLSSWSKIPFVYAPDTRRMVRDMARLAEDAVAMRRFETVLDEELGHDIAFAVEAGKIAVNTSPEASIDLGLVEKGLRIGVTAAQLNDALRAPKAQMIEAITQTLSVAGIGADRITRVILVGGSSLMGMVSDAVVATCPDAAVLRSEAFTAVIDGLALTSADGIL
ncbi:Hsp70 family protein [Shimia ponticola]|uniref:Hsp70 family protein n=1 Tax=Shimia ponticola TaxID=2582893 RepID=UPI0011BEE546|nr:Hsp70 family protein [Shimia ponticola]